MPLVSVIVPVYNAEKYLRRCLESLCHQTLTDIEIICVDDCSIDRSLEILREYAAKYPQLRIHTCEKNGGESVARNCGLRLAKGEYLGFVDNDDEVDLDFFERLYARAIATGADVVKGNLREIAYDGHSALSSYNDVIRRKKTRFAFAWHWWTAIYRASVVSDNGIRFLEGCLLGGDVLFLNEVMLCSKGLELVDDVYYHYYRREDSGDSRILTPAKIRSVVGVYERIVDNVLAAGDIIDDAGKKLICSWCFKNSFVCAYRLKTQDTLRYCIEKAFDIYAKIGAWLFDDASLAFPIVIRFFKDGDREGLFAFMLKNDTSQKMMFANLRYLQEQRKRQSQRGE